MSDIKVLFLCYVNRSGSTYMANVLSSAEQIFVFPEAEVLIELLLQEPDRICGDITCYKLQQAAVNDPKLKYWNIAQRIDFTSARHMRHWDLFLQILKIYAQKTNTEARFYVFKGERLISLYKIYQRQVESRNKLLWICLIRDPRAIYNSQNKTPWPGTSVPMSQKAIKTALHWNNYSRLVNKYKAQENFYLVCYELWIENFHTYTGGIFKWLQLSTPGDFLNGTYRDEIPLPQLKIHPFIEEGPQRERTTAWKQELGKKDSDKVSFLCRRGIKKFGYPKGYTRIALTKILSLYLTAIRLKSSRLINKVNFHIRKWLH